MFFFVSSLQKKSILQAQAVQNRFRRQCEKLKTFLQRAWHSINTSPLCVAFIFTTSIPLVLISWNALQLAYMRLHAIMQTCGLDDVFQPVRPCLLSFLEFCPISRREISSSTALVKVHLSRILETKPKHTHRNSVSFCN